jgi:CO/xanthine dehydrogenase FAD-binding subunit
VPVRIDAASDLLMGYVPDDNRIAAVAQTVPGQVEPESDIHASADFRRHLSLVLTRRALRQAAERATS